MAPGRPHKAQTQQQALQAWRLCGGKLEQLFLSLTKCPTMQTCRVEEARVLILRPLHRDIAQMFAGRESSFTSPVAQRVGQHLAGHKNLLHCSSGFASLGCPGTKGEPLSRPIRPIFHQRHCQPQGFRRPNSSQSRARTNKKTTGCERQPAAALVANLV